MKNSFADFLKIYPLNPAANQAMKAKNLQN